MDKNQEQNLAEKKNFVIFELDQEEYAVPVEKVSEVITISETIPVPNAQPYLLGVLNLRGKIIPILDLEKRINHIRKGPSNYRHILIIESENTLEGWMVDEVLYTEILDEATIEPISSEHQIMCEHKFLRGVIYLSNPSYKEGKYEYNIELLLEEARKISKKGSLDRKRTVYILNINNVLSKDENQMPLYNSEQQKQAFVV